MEYVIQQRPKGKSYSARDLEEARLSDVHASLDKLDPKDRADFVEVIKVQKVMAERIPHIRAHVSRYVGEHNVQDAMGKLEAEADAELSRERAKAALEKTAASTNAEIVRDKATPKSSRK